MIPASNSNANESLDFDCKQSDTLLRRQRLRSVHSKDYISLSNKQNLMQVSKLDQEAVDSKLGDV